MFLRCNVIIGILIEAIKIVAEIIGVSSGTLVAIEIIRQVIRIILVLVAIIQVLIGTVEIVRTIIGVIFAVKHVCVIDVVK